METARIRHGLNRKECKIEMSHIFSEAYYFASVFSELKIKLGLRGQKDLVPYKLNIL